MGRPFALAPRDSSGASAGSSNINQSGGCGMKIGPKLPPTGPPQHEPAVTKLPGHWVLAKLGKRVLRPGGLELTPTVGRPGNRRERRCGGIRAGPRRHGAADANAPSSHIYRGGTRRGGRGHGSSISVGVIASMHYRVGRSDWLACRECQRGVRRGNALDAAGDDERAHHC